MATNKELVIGTLLNNGRYEIEKILGSGGFGITYRVKDSITGEYFAVKEFFLDGSNRDDNGQVIPADNNIHKECLNRFCEEANTLARLRHDNIVTIISFFSENNTAYIVMEYIPGQTLGKKVSGNRYLENDVAVNYIGQISDAVEYVHKKNILHRDIKPDNIIITPQDKAILIDFGAARDFVQDMTLRQTIILTPGYAPPEQYSIVAKRGRYTDIYAIGATFYFILTGSVPDDAAKRLLADTLNPPIALNLSIPDKANKVIMKALQLKPQDRYQSIKKFKHALGLDA